MFTTLRTIPALCGPSMNREASAIVTCQALNVCVASLHSRITWDTQALSLSTIWTCPTEARPRRPIYDPYVGVWALAAG